MRIVNSIASFFSKQTTVSVSKITPIYTKYGLFQVKAYMNEGQEYLAIMSHNFFKVSSHIVYIHSDFHVPHADKDHGCYCDNQLEIMLKMMRKEGGVALYSSKNANSIDGLLQELNVRKLETQVHGITHSRINLGLDAYGSAYQTIGFIFSDLDLKRIYLVAIDPKIMDIAKHLEIEVVKSIAAIDVVYVDEKTS